MNNDVIVVLLFVVDIVSVILAVEQYMMQIFDVQFNIEYVPHVNRTHLYPQRNGTNIIYPTRVEIRH
jgi:hypothetical protein